MSRRLPLLATLSTLALLLWSSQRSPLPDTQTSANSDKAQPARSVVAVFEKFEKEVAALSNAPSPPSPSAALVELAEHRAERMRALIAEHPEQALEHAISWSEFISAPAALRPFLETPFNEKANLHALPICDAQGRKDVPDTIYQLQLGGATFSAFPVGAARTIGSKEASPFSGITLDGLAAVRELPLEVLSAEDTDALAGRPLANAHPEHCFASGARLGDHACVALIGGQRALFADAESAISFGEKLRELDHSPGPHTGSRVVFELADGDPGEGFDWDAAGELVQNAASSWTENPKAVMFIRVDFSDVPGEAASQATLAASLATTSASILEQSYGKTWLNSTVSATTIRMPNPTTGYLPNHTSDLHTDAMSAYEAIHGAGSLAAYDIVGVHFAGIGLESSNGINFSGLAGGSRQWLQGTTNSNTVIHEFGHNYGIGHASYWDTNDGSVVGSGSNSEYGDPFDIMGGGPDPEGHFHMQAKSKLNWLESDEWVDADISGSGTYRIYPLDNQDTTGTYRGIRAQKGSSPSEYYWLGYRTAIPGNAYLENGAYLVWQRPNYTRSWLLDTTPDSSPGKTDAALAVGTTYSDSAAGVHFTPVETGGSGDDRWIDINVQLGSFPGNAAPSVTLSGPTTAGARNALTFTAAATDPDSDPLAYSWDFGDGAISPNAASVSKTWVSGGVYTVSVTVSDMKGSTATDTLTVTVSDPLNTWTQRTSGTAADLYDLTTDGTMLLAVGSDSGTFLTSTDGITWTSDSLTINVRLRAVTYDGSKFVAAGYDYDFSVSSWKGVIYTSPDGSAWTRRHYDGEELRDIAYGGGAFIAAGDGGQIWRSTDGVTWNQIASGTTVDLDGVSYGAGGFVIVGADSGGGPAIVLTSTNGLSWYDESSGAGTASWQGFYDVEYVNDRFLASGWYSKIRHSTDGGSNFSTTLTETHQVPAFAYGNGVYLAAGINKDDADADINLISTDGQNWTALTTADQDRRNAALFFNNTFITVGNDGAIWQSGAFGTTASGGFAPWLASYFPAGSTATADPDGDGISNLAEYANATDPSDASDAAPPTAGATGAYMTITIAKNPAATDVAYSVEFCTDLASWASAGIVVVSDTDTELVVRTTSSTDLRAFLRAVYTLIE